MKFFIQLLGMACLCYALMAAALYFFQEKMLFFPSGPAFGTCPKMQAYNATAIETRGLRYYLMGPSAPERWIIMFHGNAGNACDRTYLFDLLSGFQANLVICEYPGYGNDTRPAGQQVILENALELVTHIRTTDPLKLPIFLAGESLGTGVATWVATQTPVSGLILISAYTSIASVAQHHYPFVPAAWLLRHKFPADLWAEKTTAPALLFHGKKDDTIPIEFARKQVLNFSGATHLIEIENCGHNDITDVGSRIIQQQVGELLKRTPAI